MEENQGVTSIFQIINPNKAAFNFSSAANSLSKILSRASETRNSLEASLRKSSESLQNIETKLAESESQIAQINSNSSQIQEFVGISNQAIGEIQRNVEFAQSVLSDAENLRLNIEGYGENLSNFDKQLTHRERRFSEGTSKLDSLIAEFSEQKAFVDAIIEQSDNMLSGATVAGLSSEFKIIRDDLSLQVSSSQKIFYVSLCVLFILSIPLIVFIFAPIFAPFVTTNETLINSIASTSSEKTGWQYVGGVLARFVVLLPGVWFVSFASRRYNSLFSLREHYSYKYSMAVAVEGFKKQAPGYENLIAALVFEQLAFNPADKLVKPNTNDSDDDSVRKMDASKNPRL